jgi:hypothetical protein
MFFAKGFSSAVFSLVAGLTWTCSSSANEEQAMMIVCHIQATSTIGAVRVEAVASSRKNARGQYRFEILKSSSSGTSQNVQSGTFSLEADRENILTTVVLDGSALGHYRARLKLDSNFGNVSCVSP